MAGKFNLSDNTFEEKYILEATICSKGHHPLDMATTLFHMTQNDGYMVGFDAKESIPQVIKKNADGDELCVGGRIVLWIGKHNKETRTTTIFKVTYYMDKEGDDADEEDYYVDYQVSEITIPGLAHYTWNTEWWDNLYHNVEQFVMVLNSGALYRNVEQFTRGLTTDCDDDECEYGG